jgi:hypothetical protein
MMSLVFAGNVPSIQQILLPALVPVKLLSLTFQTSTTEG